MRPTGENTHLEYLITVEVTWTMMFFWWEYQVLSIRLKTLGGQVGEKKASFGWPLVTLVEYAQIDLLGFND